eukprot:Sspe_Gene.207::Locus_76_Transcript_21_57_Confidence_1.000_Length_2209::g.207::m.207/K14833/NOC2; nucleolar complex protein 2
MVRSNVKQSKRTKKWGKMGNLPKELEFRQKVKPKMHSMMDAEKKRIDREKKELEEEELQHMEDIRNLKETDPELLAHLSKHDPDSLGFADEIEQNFDEELEGEEGEEAAADADDAADEAVADSRTLTLELVDGWMKNMVNEKSHRSLRKSLVALKTAAKQGYMGKSQEEEPSKPVQFTIHDDEVFEHVVSTCSTEVPGVLNAILKRKRGGVLPHKCQGWDKIAPLAKSFGSSVAELLATADMPDVLVAQLLRAVPPTLEYLHKNPGVLRALLKACLHYAAHSNEGIQVLSFLALREMATPGKLPPPFADVCMKGMYLTFVKNTKSFTPENHTTVSFIMNECVELFGVDLPTAYQHAFTYIRSLAIFLRTALQSGAGEEAFRHIYNWQYVNSLRLWALVVSQYHDEKELFPLVYPLVQIACGVVELFPAPKTFPLHLGVISTLNHISRTTGVYIPTSPYLLRILSTPDFQKHYKEKDRKPYDLLFMLRAKKGDLSNPGYQSAVFNEALYLLTEYLAIHSHTIGFPELLYPVTARLKKIKKSIATPAWSSAMGQLLHHVNESAQFILEKRKNVSFAPTEVEKVQGFEAAIKEKGTPLTKYYEKERKKRSEARQLHQQTYKESRRKTIEEEADDIESDDEEDGGLAGLTKAKDVDGEDDEGESEGELEEAMENLSEGDVDSDEGDMDDDDDDDDGDDEPVPDRGVKRARGGKRTCGSSRRR